MYILELIRTVEKYDQYGVHRLDGFKIIYVYFALAMTNMFFNLSHPYFYFFYLPLTAMTAEVVGETIKDKYILLIYTTLGAILMTTIFNLLNPYPLFFFAAIFLVVFGLYIFVLNKITSMLPLVPVILSLAAYSFLYPNISATPAMIFENIFITLLALIIMLLALFLFPLSLYYRLWLRAFLLLSRELLYALLYVRYNKPIQFSIKQTHLKHMVDFAGLLPYNFHFFSILKINLIMNQLYLSCLVKESENNKLSSTELDLFIKNIKLLNRAIKNEEKAPLIFTKNSAFIKLIKSWNYLCSN